MIKTVTAYLQTVGGKRILTSLVGNLFIAVGIALFKQSALGNDPYTGMNMALADLFGIAFPVQQLGVSPYDATALILDRRLPRVPYFWCRIFTDGTCALICFLAGGIVGIGTLVTAFGFGPVIAFFNRLVAPLFGAKKTSAE